MQNFNSNIETLNLIQLSYIFQNKEISLLQNFIPVSRPLGVYYFLNSYKT